MCQAYLKHLYKYTPKLCLVYQSIFKPEHMHIFPKCVIPVVKLLCNFCICGCLKQSIGIETARVYLRI